jgi:hypothetical protein
MYTTSLMWPIGGITEIRSAKAGDSHITSPQAGDTVLHTAADSGHDKFVVYFLSIGIALESRNNVRSSLSPFLSLSVCGQRKLTPLHCAARSGKNQTVALLVSVVSLVTTIFIISLPLTY